MVEGVSSIGPTQDYFQRIITKEAVVQGTTPGEELPNFSPDFQEVSGEFGKEQIQQAVGKMNKTMETYNTELRFKFHEESGEYIVKIINPKDNSVVKEIPPERVLNMVAYFKKMIGLVVDKFA
ncbi:flagellar protein FlaG [Desulforamulus aeronauticus]|uniref:Flagellar protein FlaG n=1 Tax=Desulforamulus aeronauticus DSM 10349 TaxID=1121421 RepID=A0A1M6RD55_9FIRM|nr:flagellar protein FlaG [Desulforamulus aeronauticus]SHK30394.1 flagellar protein FlaG [Desulforamulus aeronauticus DSM 10349]